MNATEALQAAQSAGIDPVTILRPEELDELAAMGIELDALDLSMSGGHYDNLIGDETIESHHFARLGQDVITWVTDDEAARKSWVESEKKAFKALGISKEAQEPSFEGATTATHPLFIEAVEQVHNRALTELRPPSGNMVKALVLGDETAQTRDQAERVEGFMNYLYTQKMPDEFNEQDKLLFRLPISGSCFKTVFYCERTKTFNAKFVEPSDFIVPWNATDLETTPRYTHRYYESHSTFQRNQASGFYISDKVREPSQEVINSVKKSILNIEGSQESSVVGSHQHQILKCSCDLEIEEGYDYAVPYLVWVEYETQEVLRVQRNWKPDDEQQRRRVRDVHYRYAQGLGFYGYGIYHLMNGTIDASTDILKTIIDAGILDARKCGYRTRDARVPVVDGRPNLDKNGKVPPPGYYQEVNSSAEELAKAFYTIPTSPPSGALMTTLEYLDGRGQSMAGTNGVLTGDSSMANAAVGTVLALIEQGGVTFSAIYQRLHNAQTQEFKILAEVIAENIPDEGYPYMMSGNSSMVMASDFDERIDIVPVSTPDAASKSHRIMQANALSEMSLKFPGLLDSKWVLEQSLNAMRITVPDDKWQEQDKSNPLQDAQIAKLQAEVKRLEGAANESVANIANKNMQTIFSGVQAGVQVATQPAVVPIADELMASAGYVDHNGTPITQIESTPTPPPAPLSAELPPQNTSPGFPPVPQQAAPVMPEMAMPEQSEMESPMQGIETMRHESN